MMMSPPERYRALPPSAIIFVSQSEDMVYWGRHRFMMGAVKGDESAWQSMKLAPAPSPLKPMRAGC